MARAAGLRGWLRWALWGGPPSSCPLPQPQRAQAHRISTLCPSSRSLVAVAPRVALGLRSPASQGGLSRDRIPTVAQERLAMSSEATLIPGLQKQLPPGWWAMQGGVRS